MRLATLDFLAKAGLIWAFTAVSALSMCRDNVVDLRGDWGKVRFNVEIADDFDERAVGLMNRPSMPQLSGMMFIYQQPGALSFWMRNTLIPLDMLFLDPDGTVAHIHSNAIPLDETAISGGEGRLAVLEINGGLAKKLGITVGTELRHPGMPQNLAAWPCEAN